MKSFDELMTDVDEEIIRYAIISNKHLRLSKKLCKIMNVLIVLLITTLLIYVLYSPTWLFKNFIIAIIILMFVTAVWWMKNGCVDCTESESKTKKSID